MKRENIFKAIVQIIIIILCSNLCKAEYDVYSLGVSYTVDCGYIQSFADAAGINLKAGSCYKGNMRSQARASMDQEPYSELSSGTVDVFIMTAQMPYKYTEPESEACIKMSKVLLENNPDARIYIHDYWTVVRPSSLALYTEYHGWDNVNAHHLGGIKTTSLMANELNHKVYNIPVGIAIQLLREKIEQDELEGYKNADELLVDSLNLSEIGRYVQACMSFCSAYQYDVRALPGQATNFRGREIKFSTHDAKIIHDIIYETVRNTPYSGWYKYEPESLDDYLKHLKEGLRNWESFDNLYPASGPGTFIGDNGVQWNCTNIRSDKILEILTDAYVEMSRDSSLSATIQGGIGDLHFVVFRGSEIEVLIDDISMGIFKPENLDGWDDCYYKIANINKTTDVTIKFICKNNESKIDNIFWTIPLRIIDQELERLRQITREAEEIRARIARQTQQPQVQTRLVQPQAPAQPRAQYQRLLSTTEAPRREIQDQQQNQPLLSRPGVQRVIENLPQVINQLRDTFNNNLERVQNAYEKFQERLIDMQVENQKLQDENQMLKEQNRILKKRIQELESR